LVITLQEGDILYFRTLWTEIRVIQAIKARLIGAKKLSDIMGASNPHLMNVILLKPCDSGVKHSSLKRISFQKCLAQRWES